MRQLLPLLVVPILILSLRAQGVVRPVSARAGAAPAVTTGNSLSGAAAWSPDGGSVVFLSRASNLTPEGRGEGGLNVFVRRLATKTTLLVSVSADGKSGGDGASAFGQFMGDSNRVVFSSLAANLVAGDTNGVEDVFLRDLTTGVTRVLSAGVGGVGANQGSTAPEGVAGRWVLFDSWASNLVAGDTNGYPDVYVHDLATGSTELLGRQADGGIAGMGTGSGRLSVDGRWAVFQSATTNVVAAPEATGADLYVRDRQTGAVRQVGVGLLAADWVGGVARVQDYDLSADGRYLAAVLSGGRYRVGGQTNADPVAIWVDLASDVVRVVAAPGVIAPTREIRLAEGGRRVFFDAQPAGETTSRVMAWDENGGIRTLESLALTLPPVQEVCTNSLLVEVSSDGAQVLLASPQGLAGTVGLEGEHQIYAWPLATGRPWLVSADGDGNATAGIGVLGGQFSADSKRVLFDTAAVLVPGDVNQEMDVFIASEEGPSTELVSVRSLAQSPVTATGLSSVAARPVSDDGRWVLFTSLAADLINPPLPTGGALNLFLRDMEEGRTILVSRTAPGQAPKLGAISPALLSRDGRRVVFGSSRGDLVSGDTNLVSDVFLYDRVADQVRALSVRLGGGGTGNGATTLSGTDGSGRWVLMEGGASNLAPGTSGARNVFLHDLEAGVTTLISTNFSSPVEIGNLLGFSGNSVISEDGRWTALVRSTSSAAGGEVYARDESGRSYRVDPGMSRVTMLAISPDGSHVASVQTGPQAMLRVRELPSRRQVLQIDLTGGGLRSMVFTRDGRRLLLATSKALVAGDTNAVDDVYLVGVEDGMIDWVSRKPGGGAGNGPSDQPSMSADGRRVVFRTAATDLIAGDPTSEPDVVVRDFVAGLTWRVAEPAVPGGDVSPASAPTISGDGKVMVCRSFGAGWVLGDQNELQDVFHVVLGGALVADEDADTLPDVWERWHFGGLSRGALDDPDGDGVGNAGEWRAGTDPRDAGSLLALGLPEMGLGEVRLEWRAVPGLAYRLERAVAFPGPWEPVGTVPASAGGRVSLGDVWRDGALYRVITVP